ncbi:MAG: single-stranded DNA-binding protein [Cyclobacteriaceae bacterium]|nr:single-stranded DNA-binding protein [Cyclobacteriaceae bacterium]
MGGLNKAMLIGNLGKDPEVKTLDNGAKIATFPLATTETYKDRDGNKQSRTEWHNIVLWRGLADVAEMYCRKGGQVYIEGRLSTRKWDDKDGHTRYTTEIIGDNMVLLSRSDSTSPSAAPPKPTAPGDLGSVDRSSDAVNDLPY